uniref:RRM domain-containing protein n=1 Tax=Onchocerca volvulus TaxID=6282 RepID=A0A8R1Y1L2_ONCVO
MRSTHTGEMDDPCERTCYVCNLHENVTEELLRELFSQVGPLDTIILRTSNSRDCGPAHRYALIVFKHEMSVPFACEMLDRIELFTKQILVRPKQGTQQALQYWSNSSVSALHNSTPSPSITRNHASSGLFDTYRRRQNEREQHYQKRTRGDKTDKSQTGKCVKNFGFRNPTKKKNKIIYRLKIYSLYC